MDHLYGIPAEVIATRCGVDVSTARRWKRGDMPESARRLVAAVIAGDLGMIAPEWAGWSISNGVLVSPDRWEFKAGEVMTLPFLRQTVAMYEAEKRKAAELIDQPADIDAADMLARIKA